jgi:hypothetical protein
LETTKNKQIQALSRRAVGFSSLKDTHSNVFNISFGISITVAADCSETRGQRGWAGMGFRFFVIAIVLKQGTGSNES